MVELGTLLQEKRPELLRGATLLDKKEASEGDKLVGKGKWGLGIVVVSFGCENCGVLVEYLEKQQRVVVAAVLAIFEIRSAWICCRMISLPLLPSFLLLW